MVVAFAAAASIDRPWNQSSRLIKYAAGSGRAEHSILLVETSDKHGHATVSLLHRYERGA